MIDCLRSNGNDTQQLYSMWCTRVPFSSRQFAAARQTCCSSSIPSINAAHSGQSVCHAWPILSIPRSNFTRVAYPSSVSVQPRLARRRRRRAACDQRQRRVMTGRGGGGVGHELFGGGGGGEARKWNGNMVWDAWGDNREVLTCVHMCELWC